MADEAGGAPRHRSWRRWLAWSIVVPLLTAVAVLSLLPVIETNVWWIRYLDFARVQFLVALVVLGALFLLLAWPRRLLGWLPVLLALPAAGYQLYRIHPYLLPAGEMALSVADCPDGARVRVMVANVRKRNDEAERFIAIVRAHRPDVILVMETDARWDRQLSALHADFPHRVQHIPPDDAHYGMHVLSRLELLDPQVRFHFDTVTPTIVTGIRLPGGQAVSFQGLHPRPPLAWSQPTTMRDAHLLVAALHARDTAAPGIVAGDFNAVPWARVTRRAMRIGGLLDPRVGRGLYPTFDAQSVLMSWPLDQVLYQNRFGLMAFERLPAFGSDHYPVLADLCHRPDIADRQSPPPLADRDMAEARAAIEAARTMAARGG